MLTSVHYFLVHPLDHVPRTNDVLTREGISNGCLLRYLSVDNDDNCLQLPNFTFRWDMKDSS
jgi:hypothetical protein